MIRHRITKLATTFSTLNNQPFTQFLSNDTPSLQIKKTSTRSIQSPEVFVSKLAVSRQEAEQFMKKKGIEGKTILINIDPSHVMGMKRMLFKTYLKEHVYKGLAQPIDLLAKQNPIKFTKIQELKFDEAIFASTDPEFIELKKRGVNDKEAMAQVSAMYDQNPNRGGQRLSKEFGVPPQYIPVVEAAHNLGNQMYFVGLNEYDIREILANYMKLAEAKIFFMECLNYVLNEELQKQEFDILFKHKCKEYLWLAHYNFLQPINYQQIKTFKKKLKGHFFAHPYNFIAPENQNIDFRKLKDTQTDTNKLQKQAIFSVLFGNIWNKPYTNNPFVYLTEYFHHLSHQDKQTVIQIYNKHYQKYELAKSKFFQLKNQQKYNQ